MRAVFFKFLILPFCAAGPAAAPAVAGDAAKCARLYDAEGGDDKGGGNER